ncbi:Chromosome segregation ATPase [Giardia duodenalis]|uniref:Chromosome segregation ATPase n=1 Tax=Giardia intestinalis TaxID=5741 RepID=V6TGN8_GIAIN|nr:Chromosome segregation ATPase [Giardia intestinalis]
MKLYTCSRRMVRMTDVTRHFFIELKKVKSEPQNILNDMFTAWMIFIKNPKIIPQELIDKYQEIREAFQTLEFVSHDKQSRLDYNDRMKALCDFNSANEKSREEGLVEGEKNARMKMIINMLSKGLSIENVAEYSGLSMQEIENVKK